MSSLATHWTIHTFAASPVASSTGILQESKNRVSFEKLEE